MQSILFSIDPGATGAIAQFVNGTLTGLYDPQAKRLGPVLAKLLQAETRNYFAPSVAVEKVNGLPGQSGPAAFNFGANFGELIGVCEGLSVLYTAHTPALWKRALGLKREEGETTAKYKAKSLALARSLWPSAPWFARAKDDGRAEAALLGYYVLTQGLLA